MPGAILPSQRAGGHVGGSAATLSGDDAAAADGPTWLIAATRMGRGAGGPPARPPVLPVLDAIATFVARPPLAELPVEALPEEGSLELGASLSAAESEEAELEAGAPVSLEGQPLQQGPVSCHVAEAAAEAEAGTEAETEAGTEAAAEAGAEAEAGVPSSPSASPRARRLTRSTALYRGPSDSATPRAEPIPSRRRSVGRSLQAAAKVASTPAEMGVAGAACGEQIVAAKEQQELQEQPQENEQQQENERRQVVAPPTTRMAAAAAQLDAIVPAAAAKTSRQSFGSAVPGTSPLTQRSEPPASSLKKTQSQARRPGAKVAASRRRKRGEWELGCGRCPNSRHGCSLCRSKLFTRLVSSPARFLICLAGYEVVHAVARLTHTAEELHHT